MLNQLFVTLIPPLTLEYICELLFTEKAIITGDLEQIRDQGIIHANVVTRKLFDELWEIKTGTRIYFKCRRCNANARLHSSISPPGKCIWTRNKPVNVFLALVSHVTMRDGSG